LGHGGYRLHFFTGPMRAARNGPISNDVLADWGARIRGWLGQSFCWQNQTFRWQRLKFVTLWDDRG